MVDLAGPEAAKSRLKLTVKEKLLLELGQHSCDGDCGNYPIELTQKGLAESIGVRRSHVALSLQGLVEDKLVDVKKERIEGEKRRQNVYVLTPNGCSHAKVIKSTVLSVEASFEMPEGVRQVTAEAFLKVSNASLISVVNQLERGDLVRDEITIVTRPEMRLITVFCPTCKKYLEVENAYIDETVGFDCPGCGRPYTIAPTERVMARGRQSSGLGNVWPVLVIITGLIGGIAAYRLYLESFICGLVVAVMALVIILAIYAASLRALRGETPPRRSIAIKISIVAIILGFSMILFWDSLISRIDILDELTWFAPLVLGVVLSYAAISRTAPELNGEFTLSGGALLIMLAVVLTTGGSLEGLSEGSAPFLGILGVSLLVISTTFPLERNLWTMDIMLSTGVLVLIIAFAMVLPDVESSIGALTFAVLVFLGFAFSILRFAQQRTSIPLGGLIASTLPLAVGALFFITGLFMIGGGSGIAGVVEIGIMIPFIYYGLTKVFDKDWMYRLPIASFLVFAEIICFAYAFMT